MDAANPFIIWRIDTRGQVSVPEIPSESLPLVGFLYLTQGEVLVETEGQQYLCSSGHCLMIPESRAISIRYYTDAVGFTGGFRPDILPHPETVLRWTEPVHFGFWFDEAVFIGNLFNMMEISYKKGDFSFIEKALDLLVSRVEAQADVILPSAVSSYLKRVFDKSRTPQSISAYAAELCVSQGHLNRIVKASTGKSAGAWIDIAKIGKAKRLLRDSDMPVAEIASAIGMDDPSYFSRFFKNHTTLTPLSFRKKMHR